MSSKVTLSVLITLTVLTMCVMLIAGCSYGTYNATGSYPNQNNSKHTIDNCTKD